MKLGRVRGLPWIEARPGEKFFGLHPCTNTTISTGFISLCVNILDSSTVWKGNTREAGYLGWSRPLELALHVQPSTAQAELEPQDRLGQNLFAAGLTASEAQDCFC